MPIKGKWIKNDGVTITSNEDDEVKQVEGTDGSGGTPQKDVILVNSHIANGYIDTGFIPSSTAFEVKILDVDNGLAELVEGVHWTLVRSALNGPKRRVVFDSTLSPGGIEIPDIADPAPSQGIESLIANGEKLVISYAR